jgi:hypothetical protein
MVLGVAAAGRFPASRRRAGAGRCRGGLRRRGELIWGVVGVGDSPARALHDDTGRAERNGGDGLDQWSPAAADRSGRRAAPRRRSWRRRRGQRWPEGGCPHGGALRSGSGSGAAASVHLSARHRLEVTSGSARPAARRRSGRVGELADGEQTTQRELEGEEL